MDQALAILLHGLDRLPSDEGHDQFMLRLVSSGRVEDNRIHSCETVLFGNDTMNDATQDSLSKLIERACDDTDAVSKACVVQILQLEGFHKLQSLPDNLHRLFRHVKHIHVVNCPKFTSLSTAVTQFSHLTQISCDGCESLTSLSSLSSLPIHSSLHTLSFFRCGLCVTRDDDWTPGMEGLARMGMGETARSYINISITECDSLTYLPSSIGKLREIRRESVALYLKRNTNLSHLPHGLGGIPQLKTLGIENCPKITQLPWSLSRLDGATSIDLSKMIVLISNMGMAKEARAFEPFFTVNPDQLDHYFSFYRKKYYYGLFRLVVLINRAKKRAIDRLCSPGGAWYEASRESFQEAMSIW